MQAYNQYYEIGSKGLNEKNTCKFMSERYESYDVGLGSIMDRPSSQPSIRLGLVGPLYLGLTLCHEVTLGLH